MAEESGQINVEANVTDQGFKSGLDAINSALSSAMQRFQAVSQASRDLRRNVDGTEQALKGLQQNLKGVSGSISTLKNNQLALAMAYRQTKTAVVELNAALKQEKATQGQASASTQRALQYNKSLEASYRAIARSAKSADLKAVATAYNSSAQRMNYTAMRLTAGLTLPLTMFMRKGFDSLKRLNEEQIRTSKLLDDSGVSAEQLTRNLKNLDKRLDSITYKWGISRELVQGLAGDFAELGITSPKALAQLTQITTEVEKLGNVDITQSQAFVQSIFQNIARIKREAGLNVTSEKALQDITQEVYGAIALFNYAENKTSLSLKNIADAFPEVSAAATSFGLTMSSTAGLLVPMVAAGFQVGASANSIKVSLQRLVIPTKQNQKYIDALSKELGEKLQISSTVGAEGIQKLINAFMELRKSSYGTQGTLELFGRIFGVRQGPRMEVAIEQLAQFQEQLNKANSTERTILDSLEKTINAKLEANNIDKISLKTFEELQKLQEKATERTPKATVVGSTGLYQSVKTDEFTKQAKLIQEAQQEQAKNIAKNVTLQKQFNDISTESGKILIGAAFGTGLTGATLESELKKAEKRLDVQYGKARESIKFIQRELVTVFGDLLNGINPVLQKISEWFKSLPSALKKFAGIGLLILAALGPAVRMIGLVKQGMGALATVQSKAASGFGLIRKQAVEVNTALLKQSDIMARLGKRGTLSETGGKVFFTARRGIVKKVQRLGEIETKRELTGSVTAGFKEKMLRRKLRLGEPDYSGLKEETTNSLFGFFNKKKSKKAEDILAGATKVKRVGGDSQMVGKFPLLEKIIKEASVGNKVKEASKDSLRTILQQIKAILESIKQCVCNAKQAAGAKPAPAATGAPANAPPAPSTPSARPAPGATSGRTTTPAAPAPTGPKINLPFSLPVPIGTTSAVKKIINQQVKNTKNLFDSLTKFDTTVEAQVAQTAEATKKAASTVKKKTKEASGGKKGSNATSAIDTSISQEVAQVSEVTEQTSNNVKKTKTKVKAVSTKIEFTKQEFIKLLQELGYEIPQEVAQMADFAQSITQKTLNNIKTTLARPKLIGASPFGAVVPFGAKTPLDILIGGKEEGLTGKRGPLPKVIQKSLASKRVEKKTQNKVVKQREAELERENIAEGELKTHYQQGTITELGLQGIHVPPKGSSKKVINDFKKQNIERIEEIRKTLLGIDEVKKNLEKEISQVMRNIKVPKSIQSRGPVAVDKYIASVKRDLQQQVFKLEDQAQALNTELTTRTRGLSKMFPHLGIGDLSATPDTTPSQESLRQRRTPNYERNERKPLKQRSAKEIVTTFEAGNEKRNAEFARTLVEQESKLISDIQNIKARISKNAALKEQDVRDLQEIEVQLQDLEAKAAKGKAGSKVQSDRLSNIKILKITVNKIKTRLNTFQNKLTEDFTNLKQMEESLSTVQQQLTPGMRQTAGKPKASGGPTRLPQPKTIMATAGLVAPDVSAAVRPKSLSAAAAAGPTVLNALNEQLAATLQMPTQMLDAFVQTLKAKGGGLAEIATSTESALREELALLQQELQKIGLTVQEAIQNPIDAYAKLRTSKVFTKGGINEVFQRLVLFQKTINEQVKEGLDATSAIEAAKVKTISRFQKTGGTAATAAPAASGKEAFGYISGDEATVKAQRKQIAANLKSQIIKENKAAIDFMQFEGKTLEYIGRAFDIEGRGKGKKEIVVAKLIAKLEDMGIVVEKAVADVVEKPIRKAKKAVEDATTKATAQVQDNVAEVVKETTQLPPKVETVINSVKLPLAQVNAVLSVLANANRALFGQTPTSIPSAPTGPSKPGPYPMAGTIFGPTQQPTRPVPTIYKMPRAPQAQPITQQAPAVQNTAAASATKATVTQALTGIFSGVKDFFGKMAAATSKQSTQSNPLVSFQKIFPNKLIVSKIEESFAETGRAAKGAATSFGRALTTETATVFSRIPKQIVGPIRTILSPITLVSKYVYNYTSLLTKALFKGGILSGKAIEVIGRALIETEKGLLKGIKPLFRIPIVFNKALMNTAAKIADEAKAVLNTKIAPEVFKAHKELFKSIRDAIKTAGEQSVANMKANGASAITVGLVKGLFKITNGYVRGVELATKFLLKEAQVLTSAALSIPAIIRGGWSKIAPSFVLIKEAIDKGLGVLKGIKIPPFIKNIGPAIQASILKITPAINNFFKNIDTRFANGLRNTAKAAAKAAEQAAKAAEIAKKGAVAGTKAVATGAVAGGRAIATGAGATGRAIGTGAIAVAGAAGDVGRVAVAGAKAGGELISTAAGATVEGIAAGAKVAVNAARKLPTLVESIIGNLKLVANKITDGIRVLGSTFAGAAAVATKAVMSFGPKIVEAFNKGIDVIKTIPGKVQQAATFVGKQISNAFASSIAGIKKASEIAGAQIRKAFEFTSSAFKTGISVIVNSYKTSVQAIISAAKLASQAIVNGAKTTGRAIVNGIFVVKNTIIQSGILISQFFKTTAINIKNASIQAFNFIKTVPSIITNSLINLGIKISQTAITIGTKTVQAFNFIKTVPSIVTNSLINLGIKISQASMAVGAKIVQSATLVVSQTKHAYQIVSNSIQQGVNTLVNFVKATPAKISNATVAIAQSIVNVAGLIVIKTQQLNQSIIKAAIATEQFIYNSGIKIGNQIINFGKLVATKSVEFGRAVQEKVIAASSAIKEASLRLGIAVQNAPARFFEAVTLFAQTVAERTVRAVEVIKQTSLKLGVAIENIRQSIYTAIETKIIPAIKTFGSNIIKTAQDFAQTLKNVPGQIWTGIKNVGSAVKGAAVSFYGTAVEYFGKVKEFASSAYNATSAAIARIKANPFVAVLLDPAQQVSYIATKFKSFAENAKTAIQNVPRTLDELQVRIANSAKNFGSVLRNVGGAAKGGLARGGAVVMGAGRVAANVASKIPGGGFLFGKTQADGTRSAGLLRGGTVKDQSGNIVSETANMGLGGKGVMALSRIPMAGIKAASGAIGGLKKMVGGAAGAVGNLASMMAYSLGPAGYLLMPMISAITAGVAKLQMRFIIITLIIGIVVAVIKSLKATFSQWSGSSNNASKKFKETWEYIRNLFRTLIGVFLGFFTALTGGSKKGENNAKAVGEAVGTIADKFDKIKPVVETVFKFIKNFLIRTLSGVKVIIDGITKIFGGVFDIIKGFFAKNKGQNDEATDLFKKGWEKVKEGLKKVFQGILFAMSGVLKTIVTIFAKVVSFIFDLFERLGDGIVLIIQWTVIGFIKAFFFIPRTIVKVIDQIIDIFTSLQKAVLNIYQAIINKGIDLFFGLASVAVKGVQKIINVLANLVTGWYAIVKKMADMFFGFLQGIVDAIKSKGSIFGKALGFVAGKAVDGLQSVVDGVIDTIGKGVDAFKDFTGDLTDGTLSVIDAAKKLAKDGVSGIVGVATGVIDFVAGLGDEALGILDKLQSGAENATEKAGDATRSMIGGFSDLPIKLGQTINAWIDKMGDGIDLIKEVSVNTKKTIEDALETVDPSAAKRAGETIADAINNGLKNLKTNFFDKVIGNLEKSTQSLADKLKEALEKQKEQALKVFDDQIAAIDALAAAEEELTAKEKAEADKRERERERQLQRQNNFRQRALAIYEGRIDDARTLLEEEQKSQAEYDKAVKETQVQEQKDQNAKNREIAKSVIVNQKNAAAEQFDKTIADFTKFTDELISKGTFTQEELKANFESIANQASLSSGQMQSALEGYFTAVPSLIAQYAGPNATFFDASLTTLVDLAKTKFGLDTQNTSPDSILGATGAMLSGTGEAITSAFTNLIAPNYQAGQNKISEIHKQITDPNSELNPAKVYGKAISDATEAMKREFMKMKTEAGSAFAAVIASINDELKGLAIDQAISEAKDQLKNLPKTVAGAVAGAKLTGETSDQALGKVLFGDMWSQPLKNADGTPILNADGTPKTLGDAFNGKYYGGMVKKMYGGGVPKYAVGGSVPGFAMKGVPALLHGGEYVINSKAVQNIGTSFLQYLNGLRNGVPQIKLPNAQIPNNLNSATSVNNNTQVETTHNYNIFVDNFIGENQWFESMMKEYNLKVVPNSQKAAGLESRVIRSYNGINKGL
jgi:hypothetical protein